MGAPAAPPDGSRVEHVRADIAGDGQQIAAAQRTTAQASLAGRLADAGVPGVIAMQGFISMPTVETMMPTFFTELKRDGQIDRALAAARARVQHRGDAWMPALYTRLTGGRLWYTPGFRGDKSKEVWRRLLRPVANGKVVPIIGPRLLETACGTSHDTAMRLAGANNYPLGVHEWDVVLQDQRRGPRAATEHAMADEIQDIDAPAQLVEQAREREGRARAAEDADLDARERLADPPDLTLMVDRREVHVLQLAGGGRRDGCSTT